MRWSGAGGFMVAHAICKCDKSIPRKIGIIIAEFTYWEGPRSFEGNPHILMIFRVWAYLPRTRRRSESARGRLVQNEREA